MAYSNDIIQDFYKRTKANLETIEGLQSKCGTNTPFGAAYEVTQLCNSLLGLLIFPQSRWFQRLPNTPLNDMENEMWRQLKITKWELKYTRGPKMGEPKPQTFRNLAVALRNAIAHCNIKFTHDGPSGKTINGLILWNCPGSQSKRQDFRVEITVEELRNIANTFLLEMDAPE